LDKTKWGIVSDLVRALSNPSNNNLGLNDTQTEFALQELADIMDAMIVNNCGFKKALKIEREKDEDFAYWIENVLEKI